MDSDLQQRIQDHYEDPYHRGRCESATHFAEHEADCQVSSRDVVAIEMRITDDEIRELWFDGDGCELSQAFASMLAENLEGERTYEVRELSLDDALQRIKMTVIEDREHCCSLALDAIQLALKSQGLDLEDEPNFGGPDLGDEC